MRVRITAPVSTFHSLMVLSSLPEAKILPSGLKLTLDTVPSCPSKRLRSLPSPRFAAKAAITSELGAWYFCTMFPALIVLMKASSSCP